MVTQTQTHTETTSFSMPRLMLHSEGAAALVASIVLYAQLDIAWWWYPLLFLLPDATFAAWALGPVWGARFYNVAHWYALPLALGVLALLNGWTFGIALALIWAGHIGADRLVGYGFKYSSAFKDTHLKRV